MIILFGHLDNFSCELMFPLDYQLTIQASYTNLKEGEDSGTQLVVSAGELEGGKPHLRAQNLWQDPSATELGDPALEESLSQAFLFRTFFPFAQPSLAYLCTNDNLPALAGTRYGMLSSYLVAKQWATMGRAHDSSERALLPSTNALSVASGLPPSQPPLPTSFPTEIQFLSVSNISLAHQPPH